MNKIPLIAMVGPTAVGKTEQSIKLSKKLNCEIISIDSVQIYKYFNIGSAKVTKEEMGGVSHHLIDELEPSDSCSVYDFQKLARKKIEEVHNKGKLPLLIGGTGFYMNAVLNDYNFSELAYIEEVTPEDAKVYLKENDPETYKSIDLENSRRVINAYNYAISEKKSIVHNKNGNKIFEKYNPYIIILNRDREELYKRINRRVEIMFETGLEQEVKDIIEKYGKNLQPLGAIGYKEMLPYLAGEVDKDLTINNIAKNSRHYAKRQLTWFRNKMNGTWYNVSDEKITENIESDIRKFFQIN
ncbi:MULTISPECIES: tRNA (adenosine(37)-N6)-dimethylallyltransferase MiaA [Gemella]|uniref:tRNA (adenosine(37)-N6)-dimethylallyltransferase MiaA n=1 Tax=Gemella TaxID=1378 RepID=UPI00092FE06B|nr:MULTISPECIES: tRNA (adenosine(37)-N6)-dimethylallyltransferase MiaA [Gemella]AXI26907.1 tRNA (adenosine(37)-N6)-dimethylallyltransferase MiaA [Gemella sp. ND 6198]